MELLQTLSCSSALQCQIQSLYTCLRLILALPVLSKAMTYNIYVSRPLKYHFTMRAGGYYLLLISRISGILTHAQTVCTRLSFRVRKGAWGRG